MTIALHHGAAAYGPRLRGDDGGESGDNSAKDVAICWKIILDVLGLFPYIRPPCSPRGVFRRRSGGRSEGRRPRARLVTSHSGGSGTPVGRHYDRSAGSLLDETGANARPSETRPGAERRRELMARAASGAPKGERPSPRAQPPQGGSWCASRRSAPLTGGNQDKAYPAPFKQYGRRSVGLTPRRPINRQDGTDGSASTRTGHDRPQPRLQYARHPCRRPA